MERLFSQAFDVFCDVQRRVQNRVDVALGCDSPTWRMKFNCPACGFEVRFLHYKYLPVHNDSVCRLATK